MMAAHGSKRTRPAAKPEEEARVAREQARVERALAQTRQASRTEPENTKPPPPITLADEGAERRVTFILRLTVDERGQPRRTEIEHARSGEREAFPNLDIQRLTAFMERCISLPNHPTTDDTPNSNTSDG